MKSTLYWLSWIFYEKKHIKFLLFVLISQYLTFKYDRRSDSHTVKGKKTHFDEIMQFASRLSKP